MRVCIFGASVIGPGNRERGEPKQDAVMLRGLADGWLGVVCDGLGSHPRSAWGARQACRAARNAIAAKADFDPEAVCASLHANWLCSLAPVNPQEAGTTCLFAYVDTAGRALCAQIGDGLVVCRSKGVIRRITPVRSGFSDHTEAMGETFRPEEWIVHENYLLQPGDGILMMTDGVSDDIRPDAVEGFFEEVRLQGCNRGRRMMRRWLTQQLHEWPTAHHSDDKTIAGIFRI